MKPAVLSYAANFLTSFNDNIVMIYDLKSKLEKSFWAYSF